MLKYKVFKPIITLYVKIFITSYRKAQNYQITESQPYEIRRFARTENKAN